jgi:nucleoside-diphosphate-sugar epimerase
MKVLVTGATGFIGSHLVDALLARGDEVRILVRKTSDTKYIKGYIENKEIEQVYGDLEDSPSLRNATGDMDIVYHLAGIVGKGIFSSDICQQLHKINVLGTENLLKACLTNNIHKFVYFSSAASIGPVKSVADETTSCNPIDPYGKSKRESEVVAMNFFEENGIPVTIIRPAMVYGPRETTNKLRLFQTIQNGTFRIIGNGDNHMCFVYVDDVVQGSILAGEKKNATGEIYILSSERAYTMNEIIGAIAKELEVRTPSHIPIWLANIAGFSFEIISKILKFSPPLSRSRVKTLTHNHVYDISKAKRELGYEPKIDLEEGVRRTVEWYKENGLL